ncbi:MAG: ABC transporter substrate-binding protein [Saccharofermentanales bacterium]
MKIKKLLAILLTIGMLLTVVACGEKKEATKSDDKKEDQKTESKEESDETEEVVQRSLTVSGISSTSQFLPVYVCREKGWFEEVGLDVEEVMFTGGPVQMEAMASDSWDLGLTGIGGVLAGVIRYDGIVVNTNSTDDGGNYVFTRNDSDIVSAGKGNNTLDPEIYGTADTWKGKTVLTSTGTVLEYSLVKTLSGFGLSKGDVNIVAMDGPTIYSSFIAGEGDIAVAGNAAGSFTMLGMKDQFTPVSSARLAKTGIITSVIANPKSYADAEKYEAMKTFTEQYFRAVKWIQDNTDEAAQMMLDFAEEGGTKTDLETCKTMITADDYYSVEEAYKLATEKSEDGDMSVLEYQLTGGLDFFISTGSYAESDKEIFAGCTDNKLITDVYEKLK